MIRLPRRKENNFFYLLGGVVCVMVLAPLGINRLDGVVSIAFTTTLLVGVWSLARTRWAYVSGLVLAVASLAMTGADLSTKTMTFAYAGLVVVFLFCAISLWIALREVLFSAEVDANRIAGAMCVYLLIGLTWTFVYFFIALGIPDAFNGLSADPDMRFVNLLYFSFVTLTTLGFGDITPATPFARALAYLEAVTGTMYMAVLVASLIGSFRDRPRKP
jgi:voltage-gated potassium channel